MRPSLWQIIIVLAILLILFGHKKIREFGKSLGEALRDFKKGLDDEGSKEQNSEQTLGKTDPIIKNPDSSSEKNPPNKASPSSKD